jgi:hypothetical protein
MCAHGGAIVPGNIDLNKRPIVKNPDGSISTVRTMGFTDRSGAVINVPTVVGDKIVSDKEAIDNFYNTGQHLGIYRSVRDANYAADQLHIQQQKLYKNPQDFAQ